jgi:MOSC domain-containing protein YiiM
LSGTVEAIYIAEAASQPMRSVPEVVGEAYRGLIGDRHYRANGGPEKPRPRGRNATDDVTLVEAEALDVLRDDHGIELAGQETRRNVLVRGIRLNDLVGKRFRLGGLLCEGTEICEPCTHMQKKVGKPILKPLVHRGGLRARIIEGGAVRVGDAVQAAPVSVSVT